MQGNVGEDAATEPDQLLLQLWVRHAPLRQHFCEIVVDAQQGLQPMLGYGHLQTHSLGVSICTRLHRRQICLSELSRGDHTYKESTAADGLRRAFGIRATSRQ